VKNRFQNSPFKCNLQRYNGAQLAKLAPPGVLDGGGGEVPCVRDVTITLTAGADASRGGGGGGGGGGDGDGDERRESEQSAGGGGFVVKVMGMDGRSAACVWSDRRIDVMEGAAAAAACRRPAFDPIREG
jgi:hypothetical protein